MLHIIQPETKSIIGSDYKGLGNNGTNHADDGKDYDRGNDPREFCLFQALTLLGSAAADLLACLSDESGCTQVEKVSAASGSIETPHPYENEAMYMFEVTVPEADTGKMLLWSFDEFEVDVHNNGTCVDQVYIYTPAGEQGPFCGFDDAFKVGLEDGTANSDHYDYYYEQLLNTHNLGEFGGDNSHGYPLRIGLKTGSHVHNYGFKLSWTLSECPEGYVVGDAGGCEIVYDEIESNRIPSGGLLSCGADSAGPGGRVDGGQQALANTWPWLVRIGITGSSQLNQCGGTILDRESIMTTARCCHAAGNVENMKIYVGEHDQR